MTSSLEGRRGGALLALASVALASCGDSGGAAAAAATMALGKTRVFFVALPGNDPASPTQTVQVARFGGGALARPTAAVAHGSGAGGWLAADVTGAQPPYTLALTVASAGLAAGEYGATVTLGAPGAADAEVEVTLAVETPPGPRTVTGRATYDSVPATFDVATGTGGLDFASATERPVRGAIVQATFDGAAIAGATATTGADGGYTLTFTPPASIGLAIQVAARTADPAIAVRDNTDGGAVWGMFAELAAGDAAKDLRATHGWLGAAYDPLHRVAAPFAILDAMYGAAAAFRAERPELAFQPLTVYWSPDNQPSASWNPAAGLIQTSQYLSAQKAIYVLGKAGVDTDEFDGHVVVHEWGHFLEDTLSRSDSIGGSHGAGDVLDPRVAWSEGSNNGLAAILLGRPVYADTFWAGSTPAAFGFDAEAEPPPRPGGTAPADDPDPSAFSEISIMRLVHDLLDGASGEGFDQVHVGLGDLHDVLAGHQKDTPALTTAASFVTGVKARGLAAATGPDVDALLAHYGIGPISTDFGEGDVGVPGLQAMFRAVPAAGSLGATPEVVPLTLDGRHAFNEWAQNRYFVVTGTGRPVTVTSASARDVDLLAYRVGVIVRRAETLSGNETITFDTLAGQPYVVSVVGWASTSGPYDVTMSFKSP